MLKPKEYLTHYGSHDIQDLQKLVSIMVVNLKPFSVNRKHGTKKKPTSDYDPQGNFIVERSHQVLGDLLHTLELENRELTAEEKTFDPFLTACAYAIRCTYHPTHKARPDQLVFHNMLLPIKFNADWALIERQRQLSINNSNHKENKKIEFHMNTKMGIKYYNKNQEFYIRSLHHILVPMKSKEFL